MKNIFKPTRKKIVVMIILGTVMTVIGLGSYIGGWVNCYSKKDCDISTVSSVIYIITLWPGLLVKFLPKILKMDWFEKLFVLSILIGYYYTLTCILFEIIQKLKRKVN